MRRRHVLASLLATATAPAAVHARDDAPATVALPGPRNSVSLPLELAQRRGLDREAGLPLRLGFVGGGGVAIQQLRTGNAEFAVFGLPAMARANALDGDRMVALAAIDDLPLYTLVVRSDLAGRVRRVADLAGRVVGVHSNSLALRTTAHLLLEMVLRRHGVAPESVRIVAAGQTWETQSATLVSRAADASMCDEPFGTRLQAEGLGVRLFSTGDPQDAASIPGAGFLRAVLVTRRERLDATPQRCEQAVRVVRSTLGWMAREGPARMADALGMSGSEREAFLAVAKAYPRQYSADGRFPTRQLAETATLVRTADPQLPAIAGLRIEDMVVDRWAGRRP